MNKKLIFLTLTVLLVIPLISATDSISKSDFILEVYNNTIHITSNDYSGNNKDFTFSISNRSDFTLNGTNISESLYVPYTKFNFSFLFVNNISVGWDIVDKYTTCLNETSACQLNAASNYTTCALTYQQKDSLITTKDTEINTLRTKQTETENQKWLFLAAGIGAGILIWMLKNGEIGKGFKNKKAEEFNKHSTA